VPAQPLCLLPPCNLGRCHPMQLCKALIIPTKPLSDSVCSRVATTPAAQSRSTSAGSSSPVSNVEEHAGSDLWQVSSSKRQVCPTGLPELPEYDYPAPFVIRNTFIESTLSRPTSLDEFYTERKVHSEPVAPPPGLGVDESPQATAYAAQFWASSLGAAAKAAGEEKAVSAAESSRPRASEAQVLLLADALGEPTVGCPQLPTIGSAGHRTGTCKPCAFVHTKGCGNGVQCSFCHLCDPGAKKRKQKARVAMQRGMRNMVYNFGRGQVPSLLS